MTVVTADSTDKRGQLRAPTRSCAARNRPKPGKLLGEVRKGDVLVVTRLDRLARSTAELLIIAGRLRDNSERLPSEAKERSE